MADKEKTALKNLKVFTGSLGRMMKDMAFSDKEIAKQEDPSYPKECGDLLSQDFIGPSPPALGGETSALVRMGRQTSLTAVSCKKSMNGGCLHRVSRMRTDNGPAFVGAPLLAA